MTGDSKHNRMIPDTHQSMPILFINPYVFTSRPPRQPRSYFHCTYYTRLLVNASNWITSLNTSLLKITHSSTFHGTAPSKPALISAHILSLPFPDYFIFIPTLTKKRLNTRVFHQEYTVLYSSPRVGWTRLTKGVTKYARCEGSEQKGSSWWNTVLCHLEPR